MNSSAHIDAFTVNKSDNGQWDAFRQTPGQYPFASQVFDGHHFFQRVFARCTFKNCTFTNCHFDGSYLQDAAFTQCIFETCTFDKAICAAETSVFEDCTYTKCKDLRFIINIVAPAKVTCSGCIIQQIALTEKTLVRWEFKNCDLNDVQLLQCAFTEFHVTADNGVESQVNGLRLHKCQIATVTLERVFAKQPEFTDSVVSRLAVATSRIHLAQMNGTQSRIESSDSDWDNLCGNSTSTLQLSLTGGRHFSLRLSGAGLSDSRFSDCEMAGCEFNQCNLSRSTFKSCFISQCSFSHATLHGMLMDCERLGTGNDFANARTKGFRIARYSLEYLGDDHGNLSKGQKMEMDIIDNVTTLRMSFGGMILPRFRGPVVKRQRNAGARSRPG